MTRTPRATSPAASDRTCALLLALLPPSTCTVRSGDWPVGEWLLTWLTWPGLLVRRRTVAKKRTEGSRGGGAAHVAVRGVSVPRMPGRTGVPAPSSRRGHVRQGNAATTVTRTSEKLPVRAPPSRTPAPRNPASPHNTWFTPSSRVAPQAPHAPRPGPPARRDSGARRALRRIPSDPPGRPAAGSPAGRSAVFGTGADTDPGQAVHGAGRSPVRTARRADPQRASGRPAPRSRRPAGRLRRRRARSPAVPRRAPGPSPSPPGRRASGTVRESAPRPRGP